MLGKLIKHEFRATARIMLPMLAAELLLAVLANVSFVLFDRVESNVLQLLMGVVIFVFFLGLFAAVVIVVVAMVNRFYRNLLCDEGYLMMTLPTNVHALICSKLIVSIVWFVVTGLLTVCEMTFTVMTLSEMSIGQFFSGFPRMAELTAFMDQIGLSLAGAAGYVVELVLLALVSAAMVCLHFFASVSLGHSLTNHKVLMSVVFFVALSFVFQVVSAAIGLPVASCFAETMPETPAEVMSLLHGVLLTLLGYGVICGGVLYLLSVFGLKKHLNIA